MSQVIWAQNTHPSINEYTISLIKYLNAFSFKYHLQPHIVICIQIDTDLKLYMYIVCFFLTCQIDIVGDGDQ